MHGDRGNAWDVGSESLAPGLLLEEAEDAPSEASQRER